MTTLRKAVAVGRIGLVLGAPAATASPAPEILRLFNQVHS
jgi:hypothetical protein